MNIKDFISKFRKYFRLLFFLLGCFNLIADIIIIKHAFWEAVDNSHENTTLNNTEKKL